MVIRWASERMGPMGGMGLVRHCFSAKPRNRELRTVNRERRTVNSIHNMESGSTKRLDCLGQLPIADQDVVGIKRADW
jgi:hypothetical protein